MRRLLTLAAVLAALAAGCGGSQKDDPLYQDGYACGQDMRQKGANKIDAVGGCVTFGPGGYFSEGEPSEAYVEGVRDGWAAG